MYVPPNVFLLPIMQEHPDTDCFTLADIIKWSDYYIECEDKFYANGLPIVNPRTLRRLDAKYYETIYLAVGVFGCALSALAAFLLWRRRRLPKESILFYYAYLLLAFYDSLTLFYRIACLESLNLKGFYNPYNSNERARGWPYSNLNLNICLTSYWIASCFCTYLLMWTHAVHRVFITSGKEVPLIRRVPAYAHIVFILLLPIVPIYILTGYDKPLPEYEPAYMGVYYNPVYQNTYGWYFPIVIIYDSGPALWICVAPHSFALLTELQIYLKLQNTQNQLEPDYSAIDQAYINLLTNCIICVAWFFFAANAVVSEELRFKRTELFSFLMQHLQVWTFCLGIPIVIIVSHWRST